MISVEEAATISGVRLWKMRTNSFSWLSSVNDVSWFDSATEEFPDKKRFNRIRRCVFDRAEVVSVYGEEHGEDREVCRESSCWSSCAEIF